jgi:hypothetical protein
MNVIFLEDIPDLLKLLEYAIRSNKPKNVDIFPLAEKVNYYFEKFSIIFFSKI